MRKIVMHGVLPVIRYAVTMFTVVIMLAAVLCDMAAGRVINIIKG